MNVKKRLLSYATVLFFLCIQLLTVRAEPPVDFKGLMTLKVIGHSFGSS